MNKGFFAGLMTVVAAASAICGPLAGAAHADQKSRQNDKNNMRNIGIAAGAGAVYEAIHGKGTNALVLGAGAAYAGKKYEDDRKAQAKAAAARKRRAHAAWVRAHRKHH